MAEKNKTPVLIIILAAVVIIITVWLYVSSQAKAENALNMKTPITATDINNQLDSKNSSQIISIENPESGGVSVNDVFTEYLWEEN